MPGKIARSLGASVFAAGLAACSPAGVDDSGQPTQSVDAARAPQAGRAGSTGAAGKGSAPTTGVAGAGGGAGAGTSGAGTSGGPGGAAGGSASTPPDAGTPVAADAGAPDTSTAPAPGNAVKFFLDTDLVIDPGDMSALAMVHGLADRCEIEIIGMTGVTTAKGAAGAMDATNVYYGRPNIPVGALKGDTFLGSSPYASRITANYPNRFKNEADVPDATAVFRKVVAAQPDASVVVVAIGPQRNLRKFVESAADDASPLNGRDLIAKKVKLLSIMGGNFEKNEVEWNIEQDVESARIVTQKWPGRQVWGGFEAGVGFQPDRGIIAKRPKSPSTFALQNAGGNSGPRPGWDQTSILYGARAGSPYWGLSSAGRISVAGAGTTPFQKDAAGQHFFIADIHIDKIPAAELKDVPPDKEYGNMSAMMNDLQTAAGHVGACAPKGSQASKE